MGVDVRWICHDCKTICKANGHRDMFRHQGSYEESAGHAYLLLKMLVDMFDGYGWQSDRIASFLSQYVAWKKKHSGHSTTVTTDYVHDFADLEDYKEESVVEEGKKVLAEIVGGRRFAE